MHHQDKKTDNSKRSEENKQEASTASSHAFFQQTAPTLDLFQQVILNELQQSLHCFKWISGQHEYHADKLGNIVHALYDDCECSFDEEAKTNLLAHDKVKYFDSTHTIEELRKFSARNLNDNAFLIKNNIKHIDAPENSSIDKKNELMNCRDFVAYILIQAIKKTTLNESNINYHLLKDSIIDPLVGNYFNNGPQIAEHINLDIHDCGDDRKQKIFIPGDLLFFFKRSFSNRTYTTSYLPTHVGFFYEYNDKGQPCICDLYQRMHDKTTGVSVVSYSDQKQYCEDMTMIHIPLKKFSQELHKQLFEKLTPQIMKHSI